MSISSLNQEQNLNSPPKIHLLETGMITAAGYNSLTTAAAVKAGINCYKDSNQYNKYRMPMKMAQVPLSALPALDERLICDPKLTAYDKHMLRLGHSALSECLSTIQISESLALFFVGSEPVHGASKNISPNFLDALMIQTGLNFDKNISQFIPTGRAGGFQAINLTFKLFESTGKEFALVGGIESKMSSQNSLCLLDMDDRILAEGVADGFVPGEAACFLLLVSEKAQLKYNLPTKMTIYKPGLADEKGNMYSDTPYTGEALSSALTTAISNSLQPALIENIYSSFNGESFGTKEFGVAMTRNSNSFSEKYIHEHPADCLGDIGAAFGSVLIALMSINSKGKGIAYCSSDYSSRSAICVETPNKFKG